MPDKGNAVALIGGGLLLAVILFGGKIFGTSARGALGGEYDGLGSLGRRHRRSSRRRRKTKMTKEGRRFISRKIRLLRKEGFPERQSVAIALNMARKRGFKTPPRPKRKSA